MTQANEQVELVVEGVEMTTLLGYLESAAVSLPIAVNDVAHLPPVAPPIDPAVLEAELARLPRRQCLHEHRNFSVYYGSANELPETVFEITRLRELTFREFEEGSGQAVDTDRFDATYKHVFVWDRDARTILGGYRLGETDKLRRASGPDGVYLGIMFDFDDAFFAGAPMLEIGRSFVAPEYQKHHLSLHLLWCGIGRFLIQHPWYRRIYGVVSMSRLYDSRTIAAIRDALLEPTSDVTPKSGYEPDLGSEWRDFVSAKGPLAMRDVSQIVKALEKGQRDVPVLIRHYGKLGARFVSAAVDGNFNNTPGLLLRLEVPAIPMKYLKQYLGGQLEAYLAYSA